MAKSMDEVINGINTWADVPGAWLDNERVIGTGVVKSILSHYAPGKQDLMRYAKEHDLVVFEKGELQKEVQRLVNNIVSNEDTEATMFMVILPTDERLVLFDDFGEEATTITRASLDSLGDSAIDEFTLEEVWNIDPSYLNFVVPVKFVD